MFWGVTIESGKRYSQVVENSFHLSMAALEPKPKEVTKNNKNISLMIEHGKAEFLLCTLEYDRVMQVPLDLGFVEGEEVAFFLNGEGIVHLTGYVLNDEDKDLTEPILSEPSESEESEEDSEEDMTEKPKQFPTVTLDDDDDDEESDDDDWTPAKEEQNKRKRGVKLEKKNKKPKLDQDDSLVKKNIQIEKRMKKQNEPRKLMKEDIEIIDTVTPVKPEKLSLQEESSESDIDTEEMSEDEDDDSIEMEEESFEDGEEDESDSGDETDGNDDTRLSDKNKTPKNSLKQKLSSSANKKNLLTPSENILKNPSLSNGKKKIQLGESDSNKLVKSSPRSEDRALSSQKRKKKNRRESLHNGSNDGTELEQKETQKTLFDSTPKLASSQEGTKTPKSTKKHLAGEVEIEDIRQGSGPPARKGKLVHLYYVGKLQHNNKQFEAVTKGKPFSFRMGRGEVIKGLDIGLEGMKVGGKRSICVPPSYGYGSKPMNLIPPNSTLCYEVELRAVS
ncbi:46 kDa FK506-binding nuclear protein-like isoform X2 [Limulus polyphemus]|uniref:peptidylprolyl isomerase n=1 Tax=Limulus polyphemus TaxID=6850 RepID=A0ABM1C4J4_LIMPO|nr:46 kDa FK506-binding nuclear protein-like isoform X2 [Limulus polyphemus]